MKHKYLTCYGGLWRLSEAAYKRFLHDVGSGFSWDLDDYGPMITGDLENVTDLTPKEAREAWAFKYPKMAPLAPTANEEETRAMKIPTIHLNGTAPERLLEAIESAHAACRLALESLAQTAPNGRDYYPQGPEALYQAADEHQARMQKVQDVLRELEELAGAIADEQELRKVIRMQRAGS